MIIEADGALVVKSAEGDRERRRLAEEAAVLRAVAHPGVVRLVRVETDGRLDAPSGPTLPDRPTLPERLVLGRVSGGVLSEVADQPLPVVAGWGAAVATVLADIHDLGYVHGAVTADHVLLDEHGRPVLCGFGSAGRAGASMSPAGSSGGDVDGLARLILDRLPPGERALRRAVAGWMTGGRRARTGARGLARMLVQRVPNAGPAPVGAADGRSPGGSGDVRSGGGGRGAVPGGARVAVPGGTRVAVAIVVAVASVVVVAIVVVLVVGGGRADRPAPARPPEVAAAAFALQAEPGEHPLTVIGRWSCGEARSAVLDVRSGAIWVFGGWPPAGAALRASPVTRVAGAAGLAVVDAGDGCDRLVALMPSGREVPVAVPRGQ